MALAKILQVFTFHDHFFQLVEHEEEGRQTFWVEDELGSRKQVGSGVDLKGIREACAEILRAYNRELAVDHLWAEDPSAAPSAPDAQDSGDAA